MKLRSKIIAGIVGGAALVGGAQVAYAGSTDVGYDVIAPIWQNLGQTDAQTKAVSSKDGHVNVYTVGSSYSTDVSFCHYSTCEHKVYGLQGGSAAYLANTVTAGTPSHAGFQISSWNAVRVEITGKWRSE